jgi:hypothetical protein
MGLCFAVDFNSFLGFGTFFLRAARWDAGDVGIRVGFAGGVPYDRSRYPDLMFLI